MSASTITTQVRVGEETAQAVARRRAAWLADCGRVTSEREQVHRRQLGGAGGQVSDIAQMRARLDAVEQHASQRSLAAARERVERAANAGALAEARQHVERVEQDAQRRWTTRANQEAVLEQIAGALADGETVVACRTTHAADGAPQLLARLDSGRELPLVARGVGQDGRVQIDWLVERSGISRFRSEQGTEVDCAAQEAFVRAYTARLQAQKIEIATVGGDTVGSQSAGSSDAAAHGAA